VLASSSVRLSLTGSTKENITLILRHDMQELEVFVEFSTLADQITTNPWCDDIKLYIVYGTYSESSQGKSIVRHYIKKIQHLLA
jgi:hypothetical protein